MEALIRGATHAPGARRLRRGAEAAAPPAHEKASFQSTYAAASIAADHAGDRSPDSVSAAPEETKQLALQRLLVEAKESAYLQGLQEGAMVTWAEAELGRQAQIQSSTELEQATATALAALKTTSEADAVAIGFAAACKILGDTVVQQGAVAAVVRSLSDSQWEGRAIRVRLHPNDFDRLHRMSKEDIGPAKVEWVPDASIARGGCIIDSDGGALDARLEQQVEALKQCLLATYQLRRASEP